MWRRPSSPLAPLALAPSRTALSFALTPPRANNKTLATSSSPPAATMSTDQTHSQTTQKDADRRRADGFRFWLDVQTRWSDNDQYGHINNAVYYHAADAAINSLLVTHCGLRPYPHGDAHDASYPSSPSPSPSTPDSAPTSPSASSSAPAPASASASSVLGFMISTSAHYYAGASFPCVLRVGLRVLRLGSSSALFELGMFELPDGSARPRGEAGGGAARLGPPPAPPLPPSALACALTRATHVYVDRRTRRPVRPMPVEISQGLKAVYVPEMADEARREEKL